MRLVTALVAALVVLPVGSALAANTAVISDPYTNATSQHATAVEPDTFAFGNTLVVAAQVGRFFGGGASSTAFATSIDGGATFTSGPLPGLTDQPPFPGGTYVRTTDPVVAYDARHDVWMISSLGLDENVNGAAVVVNRSTNGGLTWGNPVNVAVAGPANDFDKNWVVCDNHADTSPFYGRCYHTWDDFGDGDRILMSTSLNGGLTWSTPIKTDSRVFGLGGQPVVQPSGTVVVPAANAFEKAIIAFRSTNGGASWGDEVIVSHVRSRAANGNLRAGPLPSAEVGSDGRVYAVWQDCRYTKGCKAHDLALATSDDGVTWSAVQRIPIDDGGDHFLPGIGVNPDTNDQLGLTYYFYADPACGLRKTDPCELQVGYVQSNDGGANWSSPQTLAGPFPVAWTPDTSQGRMVGDYISTSWIGSKAFGAFAVANVPTGTVFDQKIYVPIGGVSASSFTHRMVKARSFSDNGARNANPRSVIRPAHRR